jgi:hypothetical protein
VLVALLHVDYVAVYAVGEELGEVEFGGRRRVRGG